VTEGVHVDFNVSPGPQTMNPRGAGARPFPLSQLPSELPPVWGRSASFHVRSRRGARARVWTEKEVNFSLPGFTPNIPAMGLGVDKVAAYWLDLEHSKKDLERLQQLGVQAQLGRAGPVPRCQGER